MEQKKGQIFAPSKSHNQKVLEFYKDMACLIFGSACGVLQLKALNGVLYFLVTSVFSSLLYHFAMVSFRNKKHGYGLSDFYESPFTDIYLGNVGRQIAIFTMMWCLLSALTT